MRKLASYLPALRAGRRFRTDPFGFFAAHDTDSGVIQFKAGFTDFTLVSDPALIQRILVTDSDLFGEGKWSRRGRFVMDDCLITQEGEAHRRRRAIENPIFAKRALAKRTARLVEQADRHAASWHSGQTREMRGEMRRLTLKMTGDALFEADLADEDEELAEALGVLLRAIPRLPIPRPSVLAARRRALRTAVRLERGPLVPMLRKAGLTRKQILDEVLALLISSVDTTPETLLWTWFLVGRHAQVEARLHAELAEVLGGREPTGDDLSRLIYLQQVIAESLRLYPAVHYIDRRPLEDVELGGVTVRANSYMLICPLITQRDARYFDDPLAFRPERWEAGAARARPAFAYYPFGAGPHGCIGEGLARLEIGVTLASYAQRWRLLATDELPELPSPYTPRVMMTLQSRE